MRKRFIFCMAAAVCCLMGSVVMAENIGTCELTGYTFMGGGMGIKDTSQGYVLVGGDYQTGGSGMWGFAWLKFGDLPTEAVDEAWLSLEAYAPGSGMLTPPSAANPMNIAVQAVDANVAGITAANVGDFKDDHIVAGNVTTATITDPGIYSWDITTLVNEWISGTNNGLVLTGWDNGGNYQLHSSFGGLPSGGANASLAPTLASTPVPEPSTIAMLVGFGLLGMAGVFRKR